MNPAIQRPAGSYTPGKATRVALYARVSMPHRGEDPRAQDPENQLRVLRQYVMDLNLEVHQEYVDRISGAEKGRPGLEQLLRDARGHRFSLVLTTKVDRFARSVLHLLNLLEELKGYGVGVRFTDQQMANTDSPTGELVLGILGYVAQFERSLISDRTKAGIARYRGEKGRWGPKGKQVTPEEVLRLRNDEQLSVRQIAARLEISVGTVHSRLRESMECLEGRFGCKYHYEGRGSGMCEDCESGSLFEPSERSEKGRAEFSSTEVSETGDSEKGP